SDSLCVKQSTINSQQLTNILIEAELLKQVITAIREARNKNQIKPKEIIKLAVQTNNEASFTAIAAILSKQVNAEDITFTHHAIANSIVVAVEQDKFFLQADREVDAVALKEELEKDLAYQQNFLQSVVKKLSNERFVQNAKLEVIEFERKKQTDAEARIRTIEESLASL
ncbi:MAG: valine--tRNA ligase, partial [Deinococcales bacterium]|nr:valine--tRNA ligase [Chitinophagaceae bacterium]